MRPDRDPTPISPWRRWLPLVGVLLLLVVACLAYLRAHYAWTDVYDLLARAAAFVSRKRLAVLLVFSGALVWGAARWRSTARIAHPAALAYAAGVMCDGIILLLLEPLGISHGPVLLPLALVAAVRCAFALGLSVLVLLLGRPMRQKPLWPLLHVAGQALIFILVVDGFVIEPTRLTVSHVAVPDRHYANARPARVVQVSDLHVERANDLTQRLVETVNGLQPDVIVLTGDYLNTSYSNDSRAHADLSGLIGALRARYGIYAVRGNVDTPYLARQIFAGTAITVLEDRWISLQIDGRPLVLAGVGIHHDSDYYRDLQLDRQALGKVVRTMPRGSFSILLYHSPDLVPEAAAAGLDLYATGHTHGGQVRLPFYGALTTLSLYGKRYEMGSYRHGNTLIYVSRGVGMEGWLMPRMRFLCPPEIVVFDIG